MNAHLIRIVERPQADASVAANDAIFDPPKARLHGITLATAPADVDLASTDGDTSAAPEKSSTHDDYVLGGYAGI
jgi:hypothetical protein